MPAFTSMIFFLVEKCPQAITSHVFLENCLVNVFRSFAKIMSDVKRKEKVDLLNSKFFYE